MHSGGSANKKAPITAVIKIHYFIRIIEISPEHVKVCHKKKPDNHYNERLTVMTTKRNLFMSDFYLNV